MHKCKDCGKEFGSFEALEHHQKAKHVVESEHGLKFRANHAFILGAVMVVLAIAYFVFISSSASGKYDDFAKCLTENNAKFYGAFWCSACSQQKALFGKSMRYVNYIECSPPNRRGQLPPCVEAEITNYPTWEFVNGSRISGVMPLQDLSAKTGCSLTHS